MLKKTGIVVDSTSYLEKEYLEKHNIKVVPLSVNIDGKVYEEGRCGEFKEVFDAIEQHDGILKTSQPPFGKFIEAYEELFSEGAEQILVICFSSVLSGTANGALLAANEFSNKRIKVIDTYTAAGVLKYIIKESIEDLENGKDLDEIETDIKEKVKKSSIDLTVLDLGYLKRGGRLSNSQAIIGNILKIKPIISLIDGGLTLTEKVRGSKKAVQLMVDKVEAFDGEPRRISIGYVENTSEAVRAEEELRERFPNVEITLDEIGPVIGGHLGPGSFGICTLYK